MAGGACAAGDREGAEAGAAVLREGGSAADAVVAAALVSCVTLPTMTGLGGAGVFTVALPEGVFVLDAFADVPSGHARADGAGRRTVLVRFGGAEQAFHVGPATVAVPGMWAGLVALHERAGRLPLARLVEPALAVARGGFVVEEGFRRAALLLAEIFRASPEAWALVGDADGVLRVGRRTRSTALGDLLEHLVREGRRGFYEGDVAAAIASATEARVTASDLARYEVAWSRPLAATYRGARVHVPGARSLTGVQVLGTLAAFEVGPPLSAQPTHADRTRLVEALARAESLRGDPAAAYEPSLTELGACVARCRAGSTVQISAVDARGGAVSFTSSVGEASGVVVPGRGVVLNNFLGEDDIAPPGASFVVGRRMRTGMCPTIVEHAGGVLAIGAAGSTRIRSALVQVLLQHLDRGLPLQQAIDEARVHVEAGALVVEAPGRTAEEIAQLLAWPGGSTSLVPELGFYFGGVQAAFASPASIDAGADVARRGCAVAHA